MLPIACAHNNHCWALGPIEAEPEGLLNGQTNEVLERRGGPVLATIVRGCDILVLANDDEDEGVVAVETSTHVSYAQRAETLMKLSRALLNWSIGCNLQHAKHTTHASRCTRFAIVTVRNAWLRQCISARSLNTLWFNRRQSRGVRCSSHEPNDENDGVRTRFSKEIIETGI